MTVNPLSVVGLYGTGMPPRVTLANSDPDLIKRAEKIARRFEKAAEELDNVRVERDALIGELRRLGWGYDRIAGALRLTKARVQQIATSADFDRINRQLLEAQRNRPFD